jgi:hypothetical protein
MSDERLAHCACVADIDSLMLPWMPHVLDLSVVGHNVFTWSAQPGLPGTIAVNSVIDRQCIMHLQLVPKAIKLALHGEMRRPDG